MLYALVWLYSTQLLISPADTVTNLTILHHHRSAISRTNQQVMRFVFLLRHMLTNTRMFTMHRPGEKKHQTKVGMTISYCIRMSTREG